jgi:hypothetical protein
MTFITRIEAAVVHYCTVPPRAGLGDGTVWQCDECKTYWGITRCIGDYMTYLDWRKMKSGTRFLSVLNVDRFPVLRQPEQAAII